MKQINLVNCRALRRGVAALLLTVSVVANAYDFEVDGIYYGIRGSNVYVTYEYYEGMGYDGKYDTFPDECYSDYSGNVVIPDSVTYDGITYAVTAIGYGAFEYCSSLTSVVIPESVTSIGSLAFYCCTGLTEVTIPNSVTEIGGWAFRRCSSLTDVTLPDSLTTISDALFDGCSSLTGELVIPDGVTKIYFNAFDSCKGLTEISIPNSVTEIGNYAFYNCTGLTGITIPGSVISIGWYAFENCTGLTSITIPESVTEIGYGAFWKCLGLTQFEVEEGNEYYCAVDGVLFTKDMTELIQFPPASSMTSYAIPEGVTTINSYAFEYCSGLTEVAIPNSVTEIGRDAFRYCTGLTQVTIGNSVATIRNSAFEFCSSLTSIYSLNPEPPRCVSSVFLYVDKSTCVLYVPEGTKEAYSTADQWKDFLNIIDNQPNAIDDITINGNDGANGGNREIVGYYTTDGKQMPTLQKGVNIIRYADGTARKVLVK